MNGPDWLELNGQVFAVTGAANGIGFGIASALVDAGARVALLDLNEGACQEAEDKLNINDQCAIAVACDTSDHDSLNRAAAAVQDTLGPCAGLVNNAGILRSASLKTVDLDEWNQVLNVNLTGYLLAARAFYPHMCRIGEGSIVNIASIASNFPQTYSSAYSASKAGICQLSRQLAVEWSRELIRSNTVSPGMVRTPLSAAFYAEPGLEDRRSAMTASNRIGEPVDIANTVLFLLSRRSSYINAADIAVNGGMDAMLMDMVPRPGFNDSTGK